MVRVQCPYCQRRYRTELEAFGRTAVCTKCGDSFRIGESRPPFEWKSTEIAEDSWIGVPPPPERQERKHCIICDAPLLAQTVRCPECGANQVTGVVRKPAVKREEPRSSLLDVVPVRPLVIGLLLIAAGAGVYWGVKMIFSSAVQVSDELVYQNLATGAMNYLRDGGDERGFRGRFGGRVNDRNLPYFVRMLAASNDRIREAAGLLIAHGNVEDLTPLVEVAEGQEGTEAVRAVLTRIGARRLVRMTSEGQPGARAAAAKGLCRLFELKCDAATLERLAAEGPVEEKVKLLNTLVRPWPRAVGTFALVVDGQPAPVAARVEQIGKAFLLRIGTAEFQSLLDRERSFQIPIADYCAATGAAVDVEQVKELLGGELSLSSVTGEGWQGTIRLRVLKGPVHDLPGFLPVAPPRPGEEIELPVVLQ